ncbi:unnamed protein product, partial [Cylicostephanus goldi]
KDDWWKGRCNDREGIFPANYVQKCETPVGAAIPILCRARAVADFDATAANQLTLKTGDIVSVREKSSTGWWEGEIVRDGHTQAGWFPGDYVTPIPVSFSHLNTFLLAEDLRSFSLKIGMWSSHMCRILDSR